MEESKVLLIKKIFIENFDDYDIATFLVKEKFEEKHQKEKQPEWLEKYILVTGKKLEKKKWLIKRILFYKSNLQLKPNQCWEKSPRGNPVLVEIDPETGKKYVVLDDGDPAGIKVLFEAEVDLNDYSVLVLTDADLNLLSESDYQIQR